jgi:hypothetical protein
MRWHLALIAALQLPASGISLESFWIPKNVANISIETTIIPIVVIPSGEYPKAMSSSEFESMLVGLPTF